MSGVHLELRDEEWFLTDRSESECHACHKTVTFGYYCYICGKFWCEECEKNQEDKVKGKPFCGCRPNLYTDVISYRVQCLKVDKSKPAKVKTKKFNSA